MATCIYPTGLDPFTKEEVHVARAVRDRQAQRALMQFFKPENYFEVRQALTDAGRTVLIGGCESPFAKRALPRKGRWVKGGMNRKRYPSDLTDEQWELAQSFLPAKTGGRPRAVPIRDVLDAYFYLLRGGVSWRMLPHDFPAWQTVYSQVRRWKLDGVWEALHDRLRDEVRLAEGRPTQPGAAALDSQSVKSADHAGIRGYDAGEKNQRAQAARAG